ncbi:MAG: hypothetical protein E6K08_07865 [Methanobacteriota archaeon]|nr:MAG: hypothetical protein E6K08_07865 [Euryarchaeota archaeon]
MEWRDRLQRIEAIVEKDLKVTRWWWIAVLIIAATESVATASIAGNIRRMNDLYNIPFTWYDGNLRSLYAVAAFLASMILGLAFSYVHGGEIRRGTIRSIILYPVDMNDVTIAKLASSFVLATGFSTILFLGFAMPFFVYGVWPVGDFLAIHAMALLMAFLALGTGVFLAHVVAQVAGRMIVSPSLLGSVSLLSSILLTETAANVIGLQFVAALAGPQGPTRQQVLEVQQFARAISVLSPQHMGARILSDVFGIYAAWPDVHVVIPVAVLVGVVGYFFGRKLYMDILVR